MTGASKYTYMGEIMKATNEGRPVEGNKVGSALIKFWTKRYVDRIQRDLFLNQ